MSEIEIRETEPDEYRVAGDTMAGAMMFPPVSDETWEKLTKSWEESVTYTAWRGAECVGHAAYFPFDTVVPGGVRVPSGGVTRVGVRQTARRLGVGSGLLNQLTDRAAADGLTLLSLRASEAVIYRRFGYGIAGDFASVKIDPRRARPVRGAAPGGGFRMLAADEVHRVVPGLYERVGLRRPGAVTRPPSFFARYFSGVIDKSESSYVVVHTNADGIDDGYIHYSTKWEGSGDMERGTGEVFDVLAVDDAVELALWQFLFDVDLVAEWSSDERPVDEVVRSAVRDPRAYRLVDVRDEQWVRLVDVDAALRARTYQPVEGSIVIEVTDPRIPDNNGRWRITQSGATRDDAAAADLVVPIETISAAYLGGHAWWRLAAAGDVAVRDPAAVSLADALFATPRSPFCGSFF